MIAQSGSVYSLIQISIRLARHRIHVPMASRQSPTLRLDIPHKPSRCTPDNADSHSFGLIYCVLIEWKDQANFRTSFPCPWLEWVAKPAASFGALRSCTAACLRVPGTHAPVKPIPRCATTHSSGNGQIISAQVGDWGVEEKVRDGRVTCGVGCQIA